MEREETYIPYKERTPNELCRDINIKAEKLFNKKDKWLMIFLAVFFLVFSAISWYWKEWWLLVWFGAFLVGGFVFYKINQKLINDMKSAASPKQHFSIAKKLRWSVRIRNYLCCALIMLPNLRPILGDEWWWSVIAYMINLLIVLLLACLKPDLWINPDFIDDIDELEYRLEG